MTVVARRGDRPVAPTLQRRREPGFRQNCMSTQPASTISVYATTASCLPVGRSYASSGCAAWVCSLHLQVD